MISKKMMLCIMFFLIVKLVYCQINDTIKTNLIFDADSKFMGTFYSTNEKLDSVIYVDLEGRKINVLFKLPEYKHGFGSLKLFFSHQFNKKVNFMEVNGAALVYILLVKNKIKEIRIGKRLGYNSKYDPIIKEIIKKTEKNWILTKADNKRPVLFIFLFQLEYVENI